LLGRLALIVLGYAAALGAGVLAVWCKNLGISEADQLAMSGMFAFGDAITFLAVASVAAIPPSVMLFKLLAFSPRFLRVYSVGSVGLASVGLFCGVVWIFPFFQQSEVLRTVRSVAVLRLFMAPLFLLVVAPGLLQAAGPNQRLSRFACAFELCTIASFFVGVLFRR
jgi:hypothetical protein